MMQNACHVLVNYPVVFHAPQRRDERDRPQQAAVVIAPLGGGVTTQSTRASSDAPTAISTSTPATDVDAEVQGVDFTVCMWVYHINHASWTPLSAFSRGSRHAPFLFRRCRQQSKDRPDIYLSLENLLQRHTHHRVVFGIRMPCVALQAVVHGESREAKRSQNTEKTVEYHAEVNSRCHLPSHQWTHVACCLSSRTNQLSLYVNGQLEATKQLEQLPLSSSTWLDSCSNQLANAPFLLGDIDWSGMIAKTFFFPFVVDLQLLASLSTHTQRPTFPPLSPVASDPPYLASRPVHSLHSLLQFSPTQTRSQVDSLNQAFVPLDLVNNSRVARKPHSMKVIHCHDMMGGYLEDWNPQGRFEEGAYDQSYNFWHWNYVDIFIYFSHHRITIPPAVWINAGHRNGVHVLGTFITEWSDGEQDNAMLLDGLSHPRDLDRHEPACLVYAQRLVELAVHYGFDGWLINIEAKLPSPQHVPKMVNFVKLLTQQMHQAIPGSLVLWYDSLSPAGTISYDCKLTSNNRSFFDVCDGLFLDYHWRQDYPLASAQEAKERRFDIYTGIDVWGRGTYGGGGYKTCDAVDLIAKAPTSLALFAPAWTYEAQGGRDEGRLIFQLNEAKFWNGYDFSSNLLRGSKANKDRGMADWTVIENGGQGWAITQASSDQDNTQSQLVYITSYQWCRRSQLLDLKDELSLSGSSEPAIIVLQNYCGYGPNPKDKYYLTVKLLDEQKKELAVFTTGEIEASAEWKQTMFVFRNYGPGLRYVYWEDGGKDAEHWGGHFGTIFGNSRLVIARPRRDKGGISHFCTPRYPLFSLPFVSNFNLGVGKISYLGGRPVRFQSWFHMSQQDLPPTFLVESQGLGEGVDPCIAIDSLKTQNQHKHDSDEKGGPQTTDISKKSKDKSKRKKGQKDETPKEKKDKHDQSADEKKKHNTKRLLLNHNPECFSLQLCFDHAFRGGSCLQIDCNETIVAQRLATRSNQGQTPQDELGGDSCPPELILSLHELYHFDQPSQQPVDRWRVSYVHKRAPSCEFEVALALTTYSNEVLLLFPSESKTSQQVSRELQCLQPHVHEVTVLTGHTVAQENNWQHHHFYLPRPLHVCQVIAACYLVPNPHRTHPRPSMSSNAPWWLGEVVVDVAASFDRWCSSRSSELISSLVAHPFWHIRSVESGQQIVMLWLKWKLNPALAKDYPVLYYDVFQAHLPCRSTKRSDDQAFEKMAALSSNFILDPPSPPTKQEDGEPLGSEGTSTLNEELQWCWLGRAYNTEFMSQEIEIKAQSVGIIMAVRPHMAWGPVYKATTTIFIKNQQ